MPAGGTRAAVQGRGRGDLTWLVFVLSAMRCAPFAGLGKSGPGARTSYVTSLLSHELLVLCMIVSSSGEPALGGTSAKLLTVRVERFHCWGLSPVLPYPDDLSNHSRESRQDAH